jgi:hypothetical protein
MDRAWMRLLPRSARFTFNRAGFRPCARDAKECFVLDLLYIGLTIVVFAALWLLIRGVERFER